MSSKGEKMKRIKYQFLKVTTTTIYSFVDKSINGWTTEEVVENWFGHYYPDRNHATRDAHQLGNSTVVRKVEILDEKQFIEYTKDIEAQADKIEKTRRTIIDPLHMMRIKK